MADKAREIVKLLLKKLEEGGVGGVHAWFSGMPHILVQSEADRKLYRVLMWREGVFLEFEVDEEEGSVKHVYVKTPFS
jgi:hypothetical protein